MRLTRPFIGEEESEAVRRVLESGYLTQGPRAQEFEQRIAGYVGRKYAVATSSCTTALHLCLTLLDVKPGDEVVVPDFTFPATANVVVQTGAKPVLVDIDPSTLTMDPAWLCDAITERTKAIIPVHALGLCADMQTIRDVSAPLGIPIVEDAACALGAAVHGRQAGSLGDLACFSFHPRKIITTGEGGMIVLDRDHWSERLRLLCSHGGRRMENYFSFELAGFNYRLSDVHAAIGLAQMNRLEWILARRRELATYYKSALDSVEGVTVPHEPEGFQHTYQSFVLRLDPALDRDSVIASMRDEGVEVTLGTYAVHAQPFFTEQFGYKAGDLPNSYGAYRHTLAIPLYPDMSIAELDHVVEVLCQVLARGH